MDPAGMVDGVNRYAYAGGSPVGWRDSSGYGRTGTEPSSESQERDDSDLLVDVIMETRKPPGDLAPMEALEYAEQFPTELQDPLLRRMGFDPEELLDTGMSDEHFQGSKWFHLEAAAGLPFLVFESISGPDGYGSAMQRLADLHARLVPEVRTVGQQASVDKGRAVTESLLFWGAVALEGALSGLQGLGAGPQARRLASVPPPRPNELPVKLSEETLNAVIGGEAFGLNQRVVGGYRIFGTSGRVGDSMVHNVLLIEKVPGSESSVASLRGLVNTLTMEARAAGASRMDIMGLEVYNRAILSPRTARAVGLEYERVGDTTVHLWTATGGR